MRIEGNGPHPELRPQTDAAARPKGRPVAGSEPTEIATVVASARARGLDAAGIRDAVVDATIEQRFGALADPSMRAAIRERFDSDPVLKAALDSAIRTT